MSKIFKVEKWIEDEPGRYDVDYSIVSADDSREAIRRISEGKIFSGVKYRAIDITDEITKPHGVFVASKLVERQERQ